MADEGSSEGLGIDVLLRLFGESTEALGGLRERLVGLLQTEQRLTEATSILEASATEIRRIGDHLDDSTGRLDGAAAALAGAHDQLTTTLEALDRFLASTDLSRIETRIVQLSDRLDDRVGQLERRLDETEKAKAAQRKAERDRDELVDRLSDRQRRKLGLDG